MYWLCLMHDSQRVSLFLSASLHSFQWHVQHNPLWAIYNTFYAFAGQQNHGIYLTAVSALCIMISPLRTPANPCCRMKPLTRSEDEAGVFHTINKTTAIALSIFQCISVNNQHLLVLKTEHAVAVTMLRVENLAGLPSSVRVGDAIFLFFRC